jgi:hypothetical protein
MHQIHSIGCFSDNLFSITMQDKGKQGQINNFEPSHGISTQDLGGCGSHNLGMLCSYNVGFF